MKTDNYIISPTIGEFLRGRDKSLLLYFIRDFFWNAQRTGTEKDEPEGTRNIVLSDTLANLFADALTDYIKNQNEKQNPV